MMISGTTRSMFVSFFSTYSNKKSAALVASDLLRYKKLHNTSAIPQDFVIPYGDSSWPTNRWNDKAGTRVKRVRELYFKNCLSSHDLQLLKDAGMVWNVRNRDEKWATTLASGLSTYNSIYGTTEVPLDFEVPFKSTSTQWPIDLHKLKLGSRLARARYFYLTDRLTNDEINVLENAGIKWDGVKSKVVLDAIACLEIYNQKKEELPPTPPQKFMIPYDWSKTYGGVQFGRRIQDLRRAYLRNELTSIEIKLLENAGIKWKVKHS